MCDKAGLQGGVALPCDCPRVEPLVLMPLRTLAVWDHRTPVPMRGQNVSSAVMAPYCAADGVMAVSDPSLLCSSPDLGSRTHVVNVCHRILATLRLHTGAAQRVEGDCVPEVEISVAAGELQVMADSLACMADELSAVHHAQWALQDARKAVAELWLDLFGSASNPDDDPRLIVITCCQRVALLACAVSELSCRSLDGCMRPNSLRSNSTVSITGCGRWHLSHQLACGALQAVRLFQALGLGAALICQAAHRRWWNFFESVPASPLQRSLASAESPC